jgi:probable rRNA maturation factor
LAIDFFNSKNLELQLNIKEVIKRFEKIAFFEHFKVGQLNFIFVFDKEILCYNNKFLQHNYNTDVISFDYSESVFIEGDLFISIESVEKNSREYKTSFKRELYRVMIHGLLHLMKFDDKKSSDLKVMREKENYYLKLFNKL